VSKKRKFDKESNFVRLYHLSEPMSDPQQSQARRPGRPPANQAPAAAPVPAASADQASAPTATVTQQPVLAPVQAVIPASQPTAPAPRAQFALAPGLTQDGILDYSTPAGAKIYRAATLHLQDELFHCEPQGLKVFLACLADRTLVNG
jgi:hypothetical protein